MVHEGAFIPKLDAAVKSASADLINFVNSATTYVRADFYTITLSGGLVLRYCSAPGSIKASGHNFGNGPLVTDSGVKSSRGVQVSEVDLTFFADDRHQVNGVQFLDFVENLGFDGALVKIDRGFSTDWDSMRNTGPIGGTYIRFSGKFSEAKELGQSKVIVTAASPMDLLTNNAPQDVYQTSCLNVLGDAKCTIDLSAFAANGTVSASPAPGTTIFGTNLTPPDGDYDLGKLLFTSGANDGITSTIKRQVGGLFQLVVALPQAPAAGDTFTAYPGCNLSMARCTSKFNNLIHFRGQPFIPDPATGLPT